MICVRCLHDSKYTERQGGTCPKCGGAFAFEPRAGALFSDAAFEAALARVSSGGKVRWTRDHLYYELARRLQRKQVPALLFVGLGALFAVLGVVAGAPPLGFLTALFWAIAAGVAYRHRRAAITLPRAAVDPLLDRWIAVHGAPAALIVRRALPAAKASRPLPADIAGYSFDRAVVCDRPETVDLLLANNFHFENNCAVLSVDGYPAPAFEVVRGMLRNNPKLVVYALHDASVRGVGLARLLATSPAWFAGGRARVVDVGLSPRHARAFPGLWSETSGEGDARIAPGPDARWLATYSLELAVIRPEQVIKRLFRAIAGTPDVDALAVAEVDFTADAAASDGGGDSFG